jgi:uncharacterized protein DUF998
MQGRHDEMSSPSVLTSRLLQAGAISGPLFIVVVLVQAVLRPGFDLRVHLISLLSLGDYGFVQIANFALCGVFCLLAAVGIWRALRRGPGGTFGPIFAALHGALLIVVAFYVTDPVNGFPPEAVAPTAPTPSGIVHAGGALWVFVTNAFALAALSRHFIARREGVWVAYCLVSFVTMLLVFFGSFTFSTNAALFLDVSLAIGWMGLSMIALKLLQDIAMNRLAPATS